MTKRRLSQQQRTRIVEKQQRELTGDHDSAALTTAIDKCNGLVISHYGQQLDVEALPLTAEQTVVRCYQRANLPALVTGDKVVWEAGDSGEGVIVAVGARAGVFGRPAFDGNFKPMAANIEKVLVVIAPLPEPFPNLIDRYLVAIETLGLNPVLVLNKCDLSEDLKKQELDKMLSLYESIGYPVFLISALDGSGFDDLRADLHGHTTVLVGQSGVGKSSLINRLGQEQIAIVGALSEARPKGTHTTTTAKLFHMGDCDLIDSPGIREFSLGHISHEQLFHGFREFRNFSGMCKFRDCQHRSEPGCAIQTAALTGEISTERLGSYFQILQTIDGP